MEGSGNKAAETPRGISDGRALHMLGVARKCYSMAKAKGLGEEERRRYWLMGLLHDIGYEFAESPADHPAEGHALLAGLLADPEWAGRLAMAVRDHGNPDREEVVLTDMLRTLNEADILVDGNGRPCTYEERRQDVRRRYAGDPALAERILDGTERIVRGQSLFGGRHDGKGGEL